MILYILHMYVNAEMPITSMCSNLHSRHSAGSRCPICSISSVNTWITFRTLSTKIDERLLIRTNQLNAGTFAVA